MLSQVFELAEQIKEKGQRSTSELPALLHKAERLAQDDTQDMLTRALAHRAAGNAHQLLNEFQPALEEYNRAITILESIDQPIELGRTLHAKVVPLFLLNRFDDLFECSARARRLFEVQGDRRRSARLDVNLAHAYHRLGRHVESLECSERALPILQQSDDSEGLIAATINSAVTFSSMHRFEQAEQRFREALEIAGSLNMSARILLCRFNLAYLRYLAGDTSEALKEFAALREEYARSNDDWRVCLCYLDEAEILLEIGDLDEAVRTARLARMLAKKLGLNSEIGKSLLFEAAAGLRLGRKDEAVALLQEAVRRFESEGNDTLSAVSKLQTALFRGERGEAVALSEAASSRAMLRKSGLPNRLALADIVIGRIQRALGDLDCSIDSFKSALSIAESSESQWMQFHACYELALSLSQKNDPHGAHLFRRAEAMLDSLWHRLGSDDLKMAFLADRENVYTHLVRATLDESTAAAFELSEKSRSRVLRERLVKDGGKDFRVSENETIVEYFIAGDDLNIFVLTSSGVSCVRRPAVIGRLKQTWENLERHIASCSVTWEKLIAVHQKLYDTALAHLGDLYNELVLPIESVLGESVVFVPHGFLHAIPLHALYDGQQFLLEKHRISFSPSAALYCAPAPSRRSGPPLFIAFSGGTRTSSLDEVEEAAENFSQPVVLINPPLERLCDALAVSRSLVHIAGHAGIDVVGGKLSWIETAEGRLTSRDLMHMQINTDTLVITGCQSARRMIHPGDEWQGLMRAFYMSGASTIVSAFWDIRDESARQFAAEFYEHFDGNNAPLAARNASAILRSRKSHPYFWAGFGVFARKKSSGEKL